MKQEDKLLTFTHLGGFSISKKELETRILEVQKKLENSIKEKILEALSEKDKENLKKYQDLYHVEYQRDGFFEKLFRSKKHPIISLTQPLNIIINKIPEISYCYESSLNSLEMDLKRELMGKKRSHQYQQNQTEKEQRFKGLPFQNTSDDKEASINPEHICLVHATRYFPKKNSQGQYEIETLATATHLKYPRNTIHFACNHHVESHLDGAWDDMPYVVLAPMTDVSDINHRNPMGISAVDTFYEMDVSENLKLPETAFLIYPASGNVQFFPNQFVKRGKSHAVYKTNFTPEERVHLKDLYIIDSLKKTDFEKLSYEEQDKMLSGFIKKELVREQLHQMGYETHLNQGDENDPASSINKVYRLGKRLKTLSSSGQALHSMTIFGINGINDYIDQYSPVIMGGTIDFLYALTHKEGILKNDDGYFIFTDDKNKEYSCRKIDLEQVFNDHNDKNDYLEKGLGHIHSLLKEKPELLTHRSSHVLQAWETRQKELWHQSSPSFFETYPTMEKFEKILQDSTSIKIVPFDHFSRKVSKENIR